MGVYKFGLLGALLGLGACCLRVEDGLVIDSTSTGGRTTATSGGTTGGPGGSSSGRGGSSSSSGTAAASSTGAPVPTLWVGGLGAVTGLTLDTPGAPTAYDFAETCAGSGGPAVIDGAGNLWSQAEAPILTMWSPSMLGASCSAGPVFSANLGQITSMAFDSQGNLWTTAPGNALNGYKASLFPPQGSDAIAPTWSLRGNCGAGTLCGPAGMAFDRNGSLWVGTGSTLLAFSPSHLTAGTPSMQADLVLTSAEALAAADAGIVPGTHFVFPAFDTIGNLWVTGMAPSGPMMPFQSRIWEFTPDQLENLPSESAPAPALNLVWGAAPNENESAFPEIGALAFDADGNLWVAGQVLSQNASGNLFRFSPQAIADGAAPDIVLSVGGDPYTSLAFSPIPPGLPLQP